MSTEGDAREDNSNSTSSATQHLHKSCERCGLKKRKCDGAHPCGRCIRLGAGATCSYSYRKARVTKPKPQTPGPVSIVWASDNNSNINSNNSNNSNNSSSIDASATLQVGRVVSAPLHQQYGRVSLKRCRLSPSPATGLVGMQENMFLSDYFGCVGFLPFTSQSNIRETLVKLFASSVAVRNSHSRGYSTTEQHFDSIMPADNQLPVDPSTCVFWCAVALGSLVKGRPIESVSKYSRLAREALANVSGPANAEVARAWAILAYMSDFCGDHDDFHVCLRRSSAILCDVQEQGNERLPAGLADVVKHGETIKLFVGDLDTEEVETFCSKEQANPVMNEAATEGEICQFVMRSYRSFEQAVYLNVVEQQRSARSLGSEDGVSADTASADPASADISSGSGPNFFASVMEEGAGSYSSDILDMMTLMMRNQSRRFQRIEHAADRPDIRRGIGGLIINSTLVFGKVARKDIAGALENLEKCGEVVQQYPGVCRFTMWSHITHMLMTFLTAIDGPRARGIYEPIRAAHNSALRPGIKEVPPFEEWQEISSYCDNYKCRLMESMVNTDHGCASSFPSPEECAADLPEKGARDVPVDGRQQREGASATGSGEDIEGNPAVVSYPRCISNNASASNREPERVSVVEPTVDSFVGHYVDEHSSPDSCAELGSQAAETPLLADLSTEGAMAVGEATCDESVGVEGWLDVTRAIMDTNSYGLGLDFE